MCIFCKIVAGEIPNKTIHENEDFLAFYDLYPQAKTHALVIPKQHHENFQTAPSEMMSKMSDFIKETAKILNVEKSYKLLTNNGKGAGQEIFHLHFHILSDQD